MLTPFSARCQFSHNLAIFDDNLNLPPNLRFSTVYTSVVHPADVSDVFVFILDQFHLCCVYYCDFCRSDRDICSAVLASRSDSPIESLHVTTVLTKVFENKRLMNCESV